MTDPIPNRLIGYAPVQTYRHDGALWVENQAITGLAKWADNFERVDILTPLAHQPPPAGWSPWTPVQADGRVRLHLLPTAYRPDQFARALRPTARRIRALIAAPAYRSFAIGGLFGDWGAVSCLIAQRNALRHAVWCDRIESAVTRFEAAGGPWKTRLRRKLTHRPMAALENHIVRRADMGLFNGADTFAHYAPLCRAPVQVSDLSVARADHIGEAELAAKRAAIADGPLRIVYVGRAHPMKGGLDWCAVMVRLQALGVDFRATWIGEGPDLDAMRRATAQAGLSERVLFPGLVADRGQILQALRDAHVHAFCHLTPESPRNLIEALVSATPIVGYHSTYADSLIAADGAGILTPRGNTDAMAAALTALAQDRGRLLRLVDAAKRAGAACDVDAVFRQRSEAIRSHLGAGL